MKFAEWARIINQNFCRPFLDEGIVECRDEGDTFWLRIGPRMVRFDQEGHIKDAGTSLTDDLRIVRLDNWIDPLKMANWSI